MPSYLDMTAANALLKEYYDDQKVQTLVYESNPSWAMLPKDEDAQGEYIPIPCIFATSQGAGSNFATAQTNQVALQAVKFLLTVKPGYSIATIQNQAIRASASDKGSFLRLAKTHIDAAIRREKLRLACFQFRAGTGSIASVNASGWTAGVATLTNPSDIVFFEVNQTLQANQTDGGATPRPALGYVIALNRNLGQVTVSATGIGGAAGTPAGWSNGDFLLTQSDNNAVLSGFNAWLPSTPPTSTDNFYGVNRSSDVVRLAGVQYSGAAQSIEEALVFGTTLAEREGAATDTIIMPSSSWGSLKASLGSKVEYVTHEGPAGISFKGIKLMLGNREVSIFFDRSCPSLTAYALQMNTWKLYSYGPAPGLLRYTEEMDMLRVYNADASEVRAGEYSNIGCEAPGWNAVIALSS